MREHSDTLRELVREGWVCSQARIAPSETGDRCLREPAAYGNGTTGSFTREGGGVRPGVVPSGGVAGEPVVSVPEA
jgi:hypothetical protein